MNEIEKYEKMMGNHFGRPIKWSKTGKSRYLENLIDFKRVRIDKLKMQLGNALLELSAIQHELRLLNGQQKILEG